MDGWDGYVIDVYENYEADGYIMLPELSSPEGGYVIVFELGYESTYKLGGRL